MRPQEGQSEEKDGFPGLKQEAEMMSEEIFLTVREVAKYLRLSEITAYRLAEKKNLPGRKHGKQWRFLKTEIEEWSKWNKR